MLLLFFFFPLHFSKSDTLLPMPLKGPVILQLAYFRVHDAELIPAEVLYSSVLLSSVPPNPNFQIF